MTIYSNPEADSRLNAYQAAGKISKSRMAQEAPLDAAALEAVEASDIVVVTGCYDHVEQVLGALEVHQDSPYSPPPLKLAEA